MQMVVFQLGNENYAFDIQNVQEIVRLQEKTKMPNMPHFMEGVINLRGKIIPVIDLAKKFNLQSDSDENSARLIVVNLTEDKQIAIRADMVTEVLTVEEADIEQVPALSSESEVNGLLGIAKLKDSLIMLLDSKTIIDAQELPKLS